MCYIQLTQGESALVDNEDFEKLSRHKWYFNNGYAVRQPKMVNGIRKGKINMAGVIMRCPKNRLVDHINGDTLDNRKTNLRIVSRKQNSWNSSCKGISYHKRDRKWQARVMNNGDRKQLGYFSSSTDAMGARVDYLKKTRGVYART